MSGANFMKDSPLKKESQHTRIWRAHARAVLCVEEAKNLYWFPLGKTWFWIKLQHPVDARFFIFFHHHCMRRKKKSRVTQGCTVHWSFLSAAPQNADEWLHERITLSRRIGKQLTRNEKSPRPAFFRRCRCRCRYDISRWISFFRWRPIDRAERDHIIEPRQTLLQKSQWGVCGVRLTACTGTTVQSALPHPWNNTCVTQRALCSRGMRVLAPKQRTANTKKERTQEKKMRVRACVRVVREKAGGK